MRVDSLFNRIGPASTVARVVNSALDDALRPGDLPGETYRERLEYLIANELRPHYTQITWQRSYGAEMNSAWNWTHYQSRVTFTRLVQHPETFDVKVLPVKRSDTNTTRLILEHEYDEYSENGWHSVSQASLFTHRPMLGMTGDFIDDRRLLIETRQMDWYVTQNAQRIGGWCEPMYTGVYLPYSDNVPWDDYDTTSQLNTLTANIRRAMINRVRAAIPMGLNPRLAYSNQPQSGAQNEDRMWPRIEFSVKLMEFITNLAIGSMAWGLIYNDQEDFDDNFKSLDIVMEWLRIRERQNEPKPNPVVVGGDEPRNRDRVPASVGSNTCTGCGAQEGHRRTVEVREYSFNTRMAVDELAPDNISFRDVLHYYCIECRSSVAQCGECQLWHRPIQSRARDRCVSCRSGATTQVRILNYSYTPAFDFRMTEDQWGLHSSEFLLMGMEIEMEINQNNYSVRRAQREWLPELPLGAGDGVNNEFFYPKSDASISHGFELCTHPFTPEWAYDNFPFEYFDESVEQGLFLDEATTIGQHIHVSRESFTRPHLARFLGLHGHAEKFVQAVGGRPSTNYARWEANLADYLKDKDDIEAGGAIYQLGRLAVNLGRSDTIELRYPQGTASGTGIRKNIEWVDAIYSFTKTLTNEQYELVEDPGYLMFWIASHPDRYGTLQSYIDKLFPRPKPFDLEEVN